MLANLFEKLLSMSWISCYIILVVLFIRLLLKKCERKYSFLLWFVVFLNLCIPFSIQAPFSFIPESWMELSRGLSGEEAVYQGEMPSTEEKGLGENYLAEGKQKENPPVVDVETEPKPVGIDTAPEESMAEAVVMPFQHVTEIIADSGEKASMEAGNKVSLTWQTVAGAVWLVVLAIIWSSSLVKAIALNEKLKRQEENSSIPQTDVVYTDKISAPFLWGLWKPVIYLPNSVEEEEKVYILAHERYHQKRFDHVTKLIVFVIVTIHWFNPLVWLSYALFVRDMEISCDEAVLAHAQKDIKKQYANSLLKYAARQNGFVLSPLTFGEPSLKSRIRNVLGYKKRGAAVTILAICLVGLAACGLTSRPKSEESIGANNSTQDEEKSSEPEEPAPQPTEAPEKVQEPLSQEQIEWFNESFFNQGYLKENTTLSEKLRNQFLTCEYETAADIDISSVFYNGAGEELTQEDWECLLAQNPSKRPLYTGDMQLLSEERHSGVAQVSQELDVCRTSWDTIAELLSQYTGYALWQTNRCGLDKLYFNKTDMVYYAIHGDTNSIYVQVDEGYSNEDGTITLYYAAASSPDWMEEAEPYVAVLQPTAHGYLFQSNRRVNGSALPMEQEVTQPDFFQYPEYFAAILQKCMETKSYSVGIGQEEDLCYTDAFEDSGSVNAETDYQYQVKALQLPDGMLLENISFDLKDVMLEKGMHDVFAVGVFYKEEFDKVYIAMPQGPAPESRGEEGALVIAFAPDAPQNYEIHTYADVDGWFGNCYMVGNSIYMSGDSSSAPYQINVETWESYYCKQEQTDAKALITGFADAYEETYGIRPGVHWFSANSRIEDVDIYYGWLGEAMDESAKACIYTAYENHTFLGALLIDLRTCELEYITSMP